MFEAVTKILEADTDDLVSLAEIAAPGDKDFFRGACFDGLDLRGLDLRGYNLDGATFKGCSIDRHLKCDQKYLISPIFEDLFSNVSKTQASIIFFGSFVLPFIKEIRFSAISFDDDLKNKGDLFINLKKIIIELESYLSKSAVSSNALNIYSRRIKIYLEMIRKDLIQEPFLENITYKSSRDDMLLILDKLDTYIVYLNSELYRVRYRSSV